MAQGSSWFNAPMFWTTLLALVVGGIITGVFVWGINPLDNFKKKSKESSGSDEES